MKMFPGHKSANKLREILKGGKIQSLSNFTELSQQCVLVINLEGAILNSAGSQDKGLS